MRKKVRKALALLMVGVLCIPSMVLAAPKEGQAIPILDNGGQVVETPTTQPGVEKLKMQLSVEYCDLSFTGVKGAVKIGNLKLDVYSGSKREIVGTGVFKAEDVETKDRFNTSKIFELSVPSWKDGDVYYLKVNGLPSQLFNTEEFIKLEYGVEQVYQETGDGDGGASTGTTVNLIKGKDTPYELPLIGKKNVVALTVKNDGGKLLQGAHVVLVDAKGKQYKGTTGADGVVYIPFTKDSNSLAVSVTNIVDGYVFNQVMEYNYKSSSAETVYYTVVMTEKASETVGQINFKGSYKNKYNGDLLQKTMYAVDIVQGENILEVITISPDGGSSNYRVLDPGNYTLKLSELVKDFDVAISDTNIRVDGTKVVDITLSATPKLGLKIINTVGGKKQNNNFEIKNVSKSYSGNKENIFDVNSDTIYTVLNKDTGKEFTVTISGNYKMTTLDIGTGRILYDGNYLGGSDVNDIPKTGDFVYLYAIAIIVAIGASVGIYYYTGQKFKQAKESKDK